MGRRPNRRVHVAHHKISVYVVTIKVLHFGRLNEGNFSDPSTRGNAADSKKKMPFKKPREVRLDRPIVRDRIGRFGPRENQHLR